MFGFKIEQIETNLKTWYKGQVQETRRNTVEDLERINVRLRHNELITSNEHSKKLIRRELAENLWELRRIRRSEKAEKETKLIFKPATTHSRHQQLGAPAFEKE